MFEFLWSTKKENRAKILVVDDDINIIKTLRDRLEINGYKVVTACDGKEGLQKALTDKPDIILLDIMMPIMSGHEMLEHLRKAAESGEISVIMLTTSCQTQDIVRAKACGIDDYIVKPFDMNVLLEKIKNILEHKSVRKL